MDAKLFEQQMEAQISTSMDSLLSELTHYREQSEQLKKINALYQRMAGVLDLPTMIETYSIWLAEHVQHELIGYRNPGKDRMHMYCSYHGPKRRQAIDIANGQLHKPLVASDKNLQVDEFYSHKWAFESTDCFGLLVLLRKGSPIPEQELNLIDESLAILAEPLKRAMEYEVIFAQAREDSLTGLPNRFVFEERIDTIIEQAKRHNHPLTMAALDLDHFKAVNDSMGHLIGDRVLGQVAEALKAQVRMTDLLVRMGGDEFLLILPDTDMKAARNLAERLCAAVAGLNIQTSAGELAISIGLSEWQPGMSRNQWLEKADDILYQAKANGRAQVAVN